MAINYKKSAILNNINIENLKIYLKKYPKSNKRIIAICDNCEIERNIRFGAYHKLCNKCSKNNSEFQKNQSKIMINYYEKYPEFGENHSKVMKERWLNPEIKNQYQNGIRKYHENNPNAGMERGKIIKNSDIHKKSIKKFNGGNDICNHHYIYDHSDLLKYTMKMTRSRHAKLHWLMRKSGIIVPHINYGDKI